MPLVTLAEEVEISVSDCGPLARGDLGVVFRADPPGKGQMYFVKGSASEICPKVISAIKVIGRESSYCEYSQSAEPECKKIKILTILELVNE